MLTDQYLPPADDPDAVEASDSHNSVETNESVSSPSSVVSGVDFSESPHPTDPFDQLPPLVPPISSSSSPSARFPSLSRTPYEPFTGTSQSTASSTIPDVPAIPVEPTVTSKRNSPPSAKARSLVNESAEADSLDSADLASRSRPIEPALVYLILLAVMVLGLGGLEPVVRYTVLWTILIGVAIMALLFDNLEVEIPTAPDMTWGIGYGFILGLPLLIIALPQLQHTSLLLFDRTADTLAFQSLAIIMPTAESLFFRGAMQPTRGLLFTALAGSAWSILLFFPQLHVVEAPLVAIVIGFAFIVLNFLYSYIKRRFGLFASWTCQITINVLLLFICRFI